MQLFRLAIIMAVAVTAAACATDRQSARKTPSTPFVRITDKNPFGVAHQRRPDGWTEILVRLNESSSRRQARDMALYYAARLAQLEKANSIYLAAEESDVYCHVTQHRGPGVVVFGDPVSLLASIAVSAISASTTVAETFEAYPLHLLLVNFSKSEQDAEGMARLPIAGTLAALKPQFEPEQTGDTADTKKKKNRKPARRKFTTADRDRWAANAQANVSVCVQRYEQQKALEQAHRGKKKRKDRKPASADDAPAAGDASGGEPNAEAAEPPAGETAAPEQEPQ